MKNKLRMIDINIVSAYMGRFLTAIVTVIVLAITISALLGGGGLRGHRALLVEVPAVGLEQAAADWYGPFRDLLAMETGRAVAVRARTGADGSGDRCELYVMPAREFVAAGQARDLVPLFSVCPLELRRDEAVLIARRGAPIPEVPAAYDVLFSGPNSVNGCWLQLGILAEMGFHVPKRIGTLRFAETSGAGTRVVYSVLLGRYALGACRASDLARAVDSGGVGKDELTVVRSIPAVPEVIVASRRADADYYRRVLGRTAARIAHPQSSGRERGAVERLKSRGVRSLRPITEEDLRRARAIFEEMQKVNREG